MEVLYGLGYRSLLRLVAGSIYFAVGLVLVAVLGALPLALLAALGGGPGWAPVAAVLLSPLVGLLALVPRRVCLCVDNGYLVAKTWLRTIRIPLGEARVELLPFEEAKPVSRLMGVGVPGRLALGRFRLVDGGVAEVLVVYPAEYALVATWGGGRLVAAYPGVVEAYRRLLKLREGRG